jgi:hypothetical protein
VSLDIYFTPRCFLDYLYRMAYAHYPSITREYHILLLGGFLTRGSQTLNESWNTLKSHDDILNYLKADIICFQGDKVRFVDSLPFTNNGFQRLNHLGRLYPDLLLCRLHTTLFSRSQLRNRVILGWQHTHVEVPWCLTRRRKV